MNNNLLFKPMLWGGMIGLLLLAGCASTRTQIPESTSLPNPAPASGPEVQVQAEPQASAMPLSTERTEFNPDHPIQYTVVRGDTLWDISARFLKNPWLWPEVWYINPQVRNPHRIYPGDVIELVYVDGKPRLRLQRTADHSVRLSPKIHTQPLDEPIPVIPYAQIAAFLAQPRVVDEEMLAHQPYVLRPFEAHQLIVGANDQVYVRGVKPEDGDTYQIVRKGKALYDPERGGLLGYEAVYAGTIKITQPGDPAVALVTESKQEMMAGDRLLPVHQDVLADIMPHAPKQAIQGRIISIYNGIAQAGRNQIVTLNLGKQNGLVEGDVLAVYQDGGLVRDPQTHEDVHLPDRHAGEILVFRSFDKVSYALIMRSTRSINIRDVVRNPGS